MEAESLSAICGNMTVVPTSMASAVTFAVGGVIALYQWFKVVTFGKKRRYNEVD